MLAGEPGEVRAGHVVDHEARIEPHGATLLAQPPVELVVLVAPEGLVEAADRRQRVAVEHPEVHGVGRPGATAPAEGRGPAAERRAHGGRDRARHARGADRALHAAHIGRPRASQSGHGPLHVVGRDPRLGVHPGHYLPGGCGHRDVEAGRGGPRRVVDEVEGHPDPGAGQHLLGAVAAGRHRHGHIDRPIVCLGLDGREALRYERGAVAGRDHHRDVRQGGPGSLGGAHRPERRAITRRLFTMIAQSSNGDQLTTYCRSCPNL